MGDIGKEKGVGGGGVGGSGVGGGDNRPRQCCDELQMLGKMEALLVLLQHCTGSCVTALESGIVERILRKCEFCLYVAFHFYLFIYPSFLRF
jgi:hypothetical protein